MRAKRYVQTFRVDIRIYLTLRDSPNPCGHHHVCRIPLS